jgi:ADP-ribose pyrophosphatase YjhB (NUDIX family)/ribosomal protein S27AE
LQPVPNLKQLIHAVIQITLVQRFAFYRFVDGIIDRSPVELIEIDVVSLILLGQIKCYNFNKINFESKPHEVTTLEPKFCLWCGHELILRDVGGTERKGCTKCSYVHWGDYSVGVGALVLKDDKVLLVRRAQEPGIGYWTNPGGYVEQFEPIQETIRREVLEESGVDAVVKNIVALRDLPRSVHNVYIAFSMEYQGGDPVPDGLEVDAAGFFSMSEMDAMNVAPFTRWLVDVALNGGSEGLAPDLEPVVQMPDHALFRT